MGLSEPEPQIEQIAQIGDNMAAKKNLNRNLIRLLRKIQKFLIEEPRRFNMLYGINDVAGFVGVRHSKSNIVHLMQEPPCGTMCCIAGAGYVIDTGMKLKHSHVNWIEIRVLFEKKYKLRYDLCYRLFFSAQMEVYGKEHWPKFYSDMYAAATTPLERACVGVARIEHFIATDGQE